MPLGHDNVFRVGPIPRVESADGAHLFALDVCACEAARTVATRDGTVSDHPVADAQPVDIVTHRLYNA